MSSRPTVSPTKRRPDGGGSGALEGDGGVRLRQAGDGDDVDGADGDVALAVRYPAEVSVQEQVARPGVAARLCGAQRTDEVAEVLDMQPVDRSDHLDHVAKCLGVAPDE